MIAIICTLFFFVGVIIASTTFCIFRDVNLSRMYSTVDLEPTLLTAFFIFLLPFTSGNPVSKHLSGLPLRLAGPPWRQRLSASHVGQDAVDEDGHDGGAEQAGHGHRDEPRQEDVPEETPVHRLPGAQPAHGDHRAHLTKKKNKKTLESSRLPVYWSRPHLTTSSGSAAYLAVGGGDGQADVGRHHHGQSRGQLDGETAVDAREEVNKTRLFRCIS